MVEYLTFMATQTSTSTPNGDLDETDYGSHGFSIKDGEGNRWSFGTYAGETT